jgi:hypothetical protein
VSVSGKLFFKLLCLGTIVSASIICYRSLAKSISDSLTTFENSQSIKITRDYQEKKFQQIIQKASAQKLSTKPMDEIIKNIAQEFLGAPYRAGLLDKNDRETLIVSLNEFDCLLFVEVVLALSKGIALEDYQYNNFLQRVENQRYRDGQLDDYCDRLHYFAEWIEDNQKRGNIIDLAASLGGIPLNKKLNFMSTHRRSYPQLIASEKNYQCIVAVEKKLSKLRTNYLPKEQIKAHYSQLRSGDIIGVTTKIAGLDVTHTGFVYRNGNTVGFIHASPAGKVTIAPDLSRYVNNIDRSSGIFVVRVIDPRKNLP